MQKWGLVEQVRSRLTYANVMATVAVFIALGGGAYALSKNEVKSKNIARGAVKRSDIAKRAVNKGRLARNSVNTRKVIDNSLLREDFAPGQLPQGPKGDTGDTGSKGDKGDTGSKGDKGDTGPQGADAASATYGVVEVFNTSSPLPTYAGVSGAANYASFEDAVSMLSPSTTVVARDLAVELDQALGMGASLTLTLRADGSNTAVSCEISDLETNCDSGAASAEIDPQSELSLGMTGAIPGPASLRNIRFGWRATTP